MRGGHPEFKLDVRNTSRYYRAPIVFWAKPEFVFRPPYRFSRRSLCPPGIETIRSRDGLKHLLTRCFDREVMDYVSHCSSLITGPCYHLSGELVLCACSTDPLISFLSVGR